MVKSKKEKKVVLIQCKGCEQKFEYKEVKRVYGEFLADKGFHSARCYTLFTTGM